MPNTSGNKKNKKRTTVITFTITSLVLLTLVVVIGLYMFLPEYIAIKSLDEIYSVLERGEYEFIVLHDTNPYSVEGSDQIFYDFEMKLEKAESRTLADRVSSQIKTAKYVGTSIRESGFWDMKMTVYTDNDELAIYICENEIYVARGQKKFSFKTQDDSLFKLVTSIKESSHK